MALVPAQRKCIGSRETKIHESKAHDERFVVDGRTSTFEWCRIEAIVSDYATVKSWTLWEKTDNN
jgi:hypothetical protein